MQSVTREVVVVQWSAKGKSTTRMKAIVLQYSSLVLLIGVTYTYAGYCGRDQPNCCTYLWSSFGVPINSSQCERCGMFQAWKRVSARGRAMGPAPQILPTCSENCTRARLRIAFKASRTMSTVCGVSTSSIGFISTSPPPPNGAGRR